MDNRTCFADIRRKRKWATLDLLTERTLPKSDIEADVALSRCAPSGQRSLTSVVILT
jgi:hypothetical protein